MADRLLDIEKISLSGSISDGGWNCTMSGYNLGQYIDPHKKVRLTVEDYLAGSWEGLYNQIFLGTVEDPSTTRHWQVGNSTVTSHTAHWYLKRGWLRTIRLIETDVDQNSHRLADGTLTSEYMLRHILTEHCNITQIAGIDIQAGGYNYEDITFQDGRFWELIDYLARAEMKMAFFDKNNIFRYKDNPSFADSVTPVMTFTEEYMADAPTFTEFPKRVAQAQCFGFTDVLVEIASFYPQTEQDDIGDILEYPSLRVGSQAELDQLAQRVYEWGNRTWEVKIPMALNHEIDIGDVIALTYSDADNDLSFSAANFLVTELNFDLDLSKTIWSGTLTAEEIP